MYLSQLGVCEDEVFVPDFFENKLEERKLEANWRAIQRRGD